MKKEQLSKHIGNIDDRLVQQAENIPNYQAIQRQSRLRKLFSAAAVFALIVSSFAIGASAFAREIIVEVPIEQETLELEGADLTLILPDDWAGQYAVERSGDDFVVYNPQIKEAVTSGLGVYDGGVLFTIAYYEEPMTEEQFLENGLDFTAYRYILATNSKTYVLYYASDVQFDPTDEDQGRLYRDMTSEIKEIQFVVDHLFDGSPSE